MRRFLLSTALFCCLICDDMRAQERMVSASTYGVTIVAFTAFSALLGMGWLKTCIQRNRAQRQLLLSQQTVSSHEETIKVQRETIKVQEHTMELRKKTVESLQSDLSKYTDPAEADEKHASSQSFLSIANGYCTQVPLELEDMVSYCTDPRKRAAYSTYNIRNRWGYMFVGKSGTGKKHLAYHLATTLDMPYLLVSASSLQSQNPGGTANNIHRAFTEAREQAKHSLRSRSIIVIDKIHLVGQSKADESNDENGKNILALITEIDNTQNQKCAEDLIIIGTTDNIDAVSSDLTKPGRLDICISFEPLSHLRDVQTMMFKLIKSHNITIDEASLAEVAKNFIGTTSAEIARFIKDTIRQLINDMGSNKKCENINVQSADLVKYLLGERIFLEENLS